MATITRCLLLLAILCLHLVLTEETRTKRQSNEINELDPIQNALNQNVGAQEDDRSDRDKRLGLIKKIGVKAVLLNLIFGKIDQFIDHKTRVVALLDKQNVIKNERYLGITPPPKGTGKPVGIYAWKENLISSVVSSSSS